jgi:hypothetical protein
MDAQKDPLKEDLVLDEEKHVVASAAPELDAVPVLDNRSQVGQPYPDISTLRAVALVALVMTSALMQVASGIGGSITIADIGADLE